MSELTEKHSYMGTSVTLALAGEQINLYPQSANLNQGAWKTMEYSWADAMVQGKDVKIEVEAIFTGTSKRPDAFDVSYWIDGVKTKTSFINQ